jgi:hypothetical protein
MLSYRMMPHLRHMDEEWWYPVMDHGKGPCRGGVDGLVGRSQRYLSTSWNLFLGVVDTRKEDDCRFSFVVGIETCMLAADHNSLVIGSR